MTTVRQWQPKRGAPGERVYGLDELAQSLATVLETPLSSVPGRPGFGSTLFELVDQPVNTVGPSVVREIVRATEANEPRLKVTGSQVVASADGELAVDVRWKPAVTLSAQDDVEQTTRIKVGR